MSWPFLNNNQNSLPEIPFEMAATCFAVGITQAGDVLESNTLNLPIVFLEETTFGTGTSGTTPDEFTGEEFE